MPNRKRRDDDEDDYDDEPRPRRRRKEKPRSRTGRIVGLSVGVLLVAAVVTIAVVARRGGGGEGGLPGSGAAKPAGKKATAKGQEADDPAVVDRVWKKLRGRWEEVGGGAGAETHEFLAGYQYRMDFTSGGKRMDVDYRVIWIRDDGPAADGKGGEDYTVRVQKDFEPGVSAGVTMPMTFNPDGTLSMDRKRFRRTT